MKNLDDLEMVALAISKLSLGQEIEAGARLHLASQRSWLPFQDETNEPGKENQASETGVFPAPLLSHCFLEKGRVPLKIDGKRLTCPSSNPFLWRT